MTHIMWGHADLSVGDCKCRFLSCAVFFTRLFGTLSTAQHISDNPAAVSGPVSIRLKEHAHITMTTETQWEISQKYILLSAKRAILWGRIRSVLAKVLAKHKCAVCFYACQCIKNEMCIFLWLIAMFCHKYSQVLCVFVHKRTVILVQHSPCVLLFIL